MTEPLIVAAPKPLRIRVKWAAPSNYSRAVREPQVIVLHATCGSEGIRSADNAAAEIVHPLPAGKRKSWHYIVDAANCIHQVPVLMTAWHAGATGNRLGLGIEICGQASQTREQWCDPTSLATLAIAARLVADICAEFKIPCTLLDAAALKRERPRGITVHSEVSRAWRESTHTDPGPGFPLAEFVTAVAVAMGEESGA